MLLFPDDTTAFGKPIDMDRVLVDPDYRRRIIARLRQERLQSEAAARNAQGEQQSGQSPLPRARQED